MERVTAKDVARTLRQHLRSRLDLGLWKAVGAKVLEPQNPFAPPTLRKPQRWFALVLIVSSAVIGAFVYFNLWN